MLKNYITIAIRNLLASRVFSFINLFGLATGLATCLLIVLFICDESRYDQHFANGDRLYRVASKTVKGETWAALSAPVAAGLKQELPEVEESARLLTFPDIATMLLKYEEGNHPQQAFESDAYYADAGFFRVLDMPFLYGNPHTALEGPNTLVLSAGLSEKYFGKANPVGKVMKVTTPFGVFPYTITGVFPEQRSHIPARYYLSMHNNDMWNWVKNRTQWANNNVFFTYVKLKPHVNQALFEGKLNIYFDSKAGGEMKVAGYSKQLFLQQVQHIYLHSALGNEIAANGNISYLYILGSIGAFILLVACINFMNLATARSQRRAREVGVRKVMGAEKRGLVMQFLGESLLLSMLALVLASVMVVLLLPAFNRLTQKQLHLADYSAVWLWGVALTLFTGLLSGAYPALYLSSFQPVTVLKGKIRNSIAAVFVRKGLVVFQFTVSVCLIVAVLVITQQLRFTRQQPLGFQQTQQIVLPLQMGYNNTESNYTSLKHSLLQQPGVESVTCGNAYPGIPQLNDMLFYAEGKGVKDIVDIRLSTIAPDYLTSLGFTLLSGVGFREGTAAGENDSLVILNETAVKQLGYTVANAPGKRIYYDAGNGNYTAAGILGVVKDFHFESLHTAIQPFGFIAGGIGSKYNYLIARVNSDNYSQLLKGMEAAWHKLLPGTPFTYSFLDQDFQRNYQKEQRASGIVTWFTCVALVIACLGLFGLAVFSAEQRRREMGIRKVLGASASGIAGLLAKDFMQLVVLAIVIATPLAWWAMHSWLQHFVYRISLSGWTFLLAGGIAVTVALLTIGFQAVKSAILSPVVSLKAE